jgi:hypothetical protein
VQGVYLPPTELASLERHHPKAKLKKFEKMAEAGKRFAPKLGPA